MIRRLAPLAAVAAILATTVTSAPPAFAGAPTAAADAIVWTNTASSTAVIYRNGLMGSVSMPGASVAVTGQFDGNAGGDLLAYNPGPGADSILHLTPAIPSGWSTSVRSISVGGTFKPFVGDFDGNDVSDVFWYAPGTAQDYIWFFAADGSHTSRSITVNGTYRPLVLDVDNDDIDDVLWYAPGSAPDDLWLFEGFKGGSLLHIQHVAQTINGTYQTVVGEFGDRTDEEGRESIVFYNPSGPDSMWVFRNEDPFPPEHISYPLPNRDGDYRLVGGQFRDDNGSIFLYSPGLTAEKLWSFGAGPANVSEIAMPQVKGTYNILAADLDAEGFTDVAFRTGDLVYIWHFKPSGRTEERLQPVPSGGILRQLEMSDET